MTVENGESRHSYNYLVITMSTSLHDLINTLPQHGMVEWIAVRPKPIKTAAGFNEKQPMLVVDSVEAREDYGLTGDRYSKKGGKRQVTLIQWEHIPVIASLLDVEKVNLTDLRRNIAVSGINLLALKNKTFAIGDSIFEYTGLCDPCSQMEATLGAGGFNAMRGHGGINVRVVKSGIIKLGDGVWGLDKHNFDLRDG